MILYGKKKKNKERIRSIISNSELDIVSVTENINEILNAYKELRQISQIILKQDVEEA